MLFYEEETERNSSGNSEEASHHPFSSSSSFLPKCDEFNMRRSTTESCLELSSASFPSWLPSQTETLAVPSHIWAFIYIVPTWQMVTSLYCARLLRESVRPTSGLDKTLLIIIKKEFQLQHPASSAQAIKSSYHWTFFFFQER